MAIFGAGGKKPEESESESKFQLSTMAIFGAGREKPEEKSSL